MIETSTHRPDATEVEQAKRELASEMHLRVAHFSDDPPYARSIRCTCGDTEFSSTYEWALHRASAFERIARALQAEIDRSRTQSMEARFDHIHVDDTGTSLRTWNRGDL
jgi:hypothetical protein